MIQSSISIINILSYTVECRVPDSTEVCNKGTIKKLQLL